MAGSSYDYNTIFGGNVHMGNVYHQGLSRDQQILQSIIESLRYDRMESRREMLAEAERGTFEWAFKEAETEIANGQWDWTKVDMTFKPWLEGGDEGMFCFVGKPGSGKSTFMKFLSNHPSIDEACEVWLEGKRLFRAEHFFWIAGTHMQKSYCGLLRNLLYQCLLAISGSDSQMDAHHVTNALKSRCSSSRRNAAWASQELENVLSRLILSLPDTKYLFFIDGLDECEPQEQLEKLARKMVWISQLPNVKLCVSCRPWENITQNLTLESMLCIDQLTYNDMKLYLESRLLFTETKAITHLEFGERIAQSEQLMGDIIQAAEGVFLWLELMVNELINAVRKNSDIDALRRVFEEFPPDLNAYLTALIYRIPKGRSNISDTASALKLAMVTHTDARYPYDFASRRCVVNFWLLQNKMLTEEIAWYDFDERPYSAPDCEKMVGMTRQFLFETCRDLLVIVPIRNVVQTPFDANVEFVHRSVFDFLNGHTIKLEIDNASPKHFESHRFLSDLLKMRWLCFLKMPISCGMMHSTMRQVLRGYGDGPRLEQRCVSICDRILARRVLDACACLGSEHHLSNGSIWILSQNGCIEYLVALHRKWPHITTRELFNNPRDNGVFYTRLLSEHIYTSAGTSISKLIRVLLMCGLTLNRLRYDSRRCGNSLWTGWLLESKRQVETTHYTLESLCRWQQQTAEVASLMIRHGADPTCLICVADHSGNVACSRISVNAIFETIFSPGHIGHMRRFLAEHSSYTVRRDTQRKQRLRAVRAFLRSEQSHETVERLANHRQNEKYSWYNEKLEFVRWFLHDCMNGGQRTQTCLTNRPSNISLRAVPTWCFECGIEVQQCETCFWSSNGTYDLLIANAFENSEIANPQCVHAILKSSYCAWGTIIKKDTVNRVIDILKDCYQKRGDDMVPEN